MPPIKGLSGLTLSSIKKYPAIIPLYVMLAAGVVLAAGAVTRTLIKNPEVSFNRKGNPEPWNDYRAKQYKFFGIGRDWDKGVESPAPDYKK
ncbi:Cytochrome c oxidase subunit NDUFA4 [Orchesella cincta]|uniref:Cytochrome c oxidase subunit NDUFA4 n=1 Tax=Orchesella cincta TaxID=48709 RepID=A0A1D2ND08_ORCCI|nr:Cytochrome c oxidase subunit NDUFA4 [Orchesella cincta]